MGRRNISGRKHGRKFAKAKRKTRAINAPGYALRGGRRL